MSETLNAPLDRAAQLYGRRDAVVDGDRTWSYQQLAERVAGFDSTLDELGLQTGDVVAVLALNSAEHLVCWLAIPRSGRVLNDLNVRLAPAELQFILNDSGAKALIVDDVFLEAGRALAAGCPSIEHLFYAGAGPVPEGTIGFDAACTARTGGRAKDVDPDAVAGIFYTGGTTGLPKGVMLSHRNLIQNAKHSLICIKYNDGDSYLHSAPMFHLADGASTYSLTWVGGKHVIQKAFDPAGWLKIVASERITRALLVPTMLTMVINHPDFADADLSSLDHMLYGASPMPEEVLRAAMSKMGCGFAQAYGMTEAAPILTFLSAEEHREAVDNEALHSLLRSAGKPIAGVEVEVRREDGVSVCDPGEPGEVYARGANIMRGYWNRPEETQAALVEGGWYRSGDAAYASEDGYIFIVDRIKDMIISGGENIYSTEVENALYEHPSVMECAVFGVPHEQWGEAVHAAVVLKPGAAATEEELVDFCKERIAGYKVPRSVSFMDALPRSGAGKILKRDLRQPFWAEREKAIG